MGVSNSTFYDPNRFSNAKLRQRIYAATTPAPVMTVHDNSPDKDVANAYADTHDTDSRNAALSSLDRYRDHPVFSHEHQSVERACSKVQEHFEYAFPNATSEYSNQALSSNMVQTTQPGAVYIDAYGNVFETQESILPPPNKNYSIDRESLLRVNPQMVALEGGYGVRNLIPKVEVEQCLPPADAGALAQPGLANDYESRSAVEVQQRMQRDLWHHRDGLFPNESQFAKEVPFGFDPRGGQQFMWRGPVFVAPTDRGQSVTDNPNPAGAEIAVPGMHAGEYDENQFRKDLPETIAQSGILSQEDHGSSPICGWAEKNRLYRGQDGIWHSGIAEYASARNENTIGTMNPVKRRGGTANENFLAAGSDEARQSVQSASQGSNKREVSSSDIPVTYLNLDPDQAAPFGINQPSQKQEVVLPAAAPYLLSLEQSGAFVVSPLAEPSDKRESHSLVLVGGNGFLGHPMFPIDISESVANRNRLRGCFEPKDFGFMKSKVLAGESTSGKVADQHWQERVNKEQFELPFQAWTSPMLNQPKWLGVVDRCDYGDL